jgi:hypothetical protein
MPRQQMENTLTQLLLINFQVTHLNLASKLCTNSPGISWQLPLCGALWKPLHGRIARLHPVDLRYQEHATDFSRTQQASLNFPMGARQRCSPSLAAAQGLRILFPALSPVPPTSRRASDELTRSRSFTLRNQETENVQHHSFL